jgi:hypothetical protein
MPDRYELVIEASGVVTDGPAPTDDDDDKDDDR